MTVLMRHIYIRQESKEVALITIKFVCDRLEVGRFGGTMWNKEIMNVNIQCRTS